MLRKYVAVDLLMNQVIVGILMLTILLMNLLFLKCLDQTVALHLVTYVKIPILLPIITTTAGTGLIIIMYHLGQLIHATARQGSSQQTDYLHAPSAHLVAIQWHVILVGTKEIMFTNIILEPHIASVL